MTLAQVAKFPRMRALAWSGNTLYASHGYQLLCARIDRGSIEWRPVGKYVPAWWRNLSANSRLGSRLVRDGFHALAVLSSGHLVAAVPGEIITLPPGETEFRSTHHVLRGIRPLHIAVTPDGRLFWGEYFNNRDRTEVHIYASTDWGASWNVAHTFAKGSIRHIHNIVYDRWEECLWVLTGDDGAECRILRAPCDFKNVDVVLSGNQQARAVALLPAPDGIYFSSDTPRETNYVYRLNRRGELHKLARLGGSSIYGCRVGANLFFSTMVEPSAANLDRSARVYGSADGLEWQSLLQRGKDPWPMGLFQYGNAIFPDGENTSGLLALTSIAVTPGDMETSLWQVDNR
jgi:hypothetical protein